jgi:hypothetical protein
MKNFTIYLGDTIPPRYQACIDSLLSAYPDLVVVREWPAECPIPSPENIYAATDALRVWMLSTMTEGRYFDGDVTANEAPDMCNADGVWMSHIWGNLHVWAMGHRNAPELFKIGVEIYKRGGTTADFLRVCEAAKSTINCIENDGKLLHNCYSTQGG